MWILQSFFSPSPPLNLYEFYINFSMGLPISTNTAARILIKNCSFVVLTFLCLASFGSNNEILLYAHVGQNDPKSLSCLPQEAGNTLTAAKWPHCQRAQWLWLPGVAPRAHGLQTRGAETWQRWQNALLTHSECSYELQIPAGRF